jgi:uncharacterized membrane protein HdeD (DUF308 family)
MILSAGSALLPVVDRDAGVMAIGSMLFVVGLVEVFAGILRRQAKGLSILAGTVTILAGLLFVFNPVGHSLPIALIITGWLIARSAIILLTGLRSAGAIKTWTLFSAAMDFLLAVLLLMHLSISSLVIALFGPTTPIVAGFAWIFALSFVVTGAMLLMIARCERQSTN